MNTRTPIDKTDDLDILSAIWILSCNDDNPIITYRGITDRLRLTEADDVKAIVHSRSELFRPGILNSRMKAWKDRMKTGKGRPAWISEIRDSKEQHKAIDSLSGADVFRNQFRVEPDAPKCNIEIIDWGLRHIERLRKDAAEEKDVRTRKYSTILIPLASLLVALVSILGSVGIQWLGIREQRELKQYEVSFAPKQAAYSTFMNAFMMAAIAATARDEANTLTQINRMEGAYYLFEPFLLDGDRNDIFSKFSEFTTLCNQQVKAKEPIQNDAAYAAFVKAVASNKIYFRTRLYNDLFTHQ